MATDMLAGQRLRLEASGRIEWVVDRDLRDANLLRSALLIFADGATKGPVAVVHPGNPSAAEGVVELVPGGLRYRLDLDRLRGKADRVVMVQWITDTDRNQGRSLADARQVSASFHDAQNQRLATFAPEVARFGREAAVIHTELYFKDGWRVRADGSGFVGGIMALASRLGVSAPEAQAMEGRGVVVPPGASAGAPDPGAGPGGPLAASLPVRLPSARSGPAVRPVPSGLLASVARVYVTATGDRTWTGTAFAITPGGCLVTCEHVVAEAVLITVVFHHESRHRVCKVMAMDEGLDVALIQPLDADGTEHWLEVAAPDSPADLGTEVGLLGFPLGSLGEEINYSQGIINSTRKAQGVRMLQVDAGAAPGSSGGPLFRRSDGAVIGVLGGGLRGESLGMHVNLAISADALAALGWVTRERTP